MALRAVAPAEFKALDLSSIILDAVIGIAVGITGGTALGIAGGTVLGIAGGTAQGIAGGIAQGIAVGIAVGVALGIAGGIVGGIAVGIAQGIVLGIAGGIVLGIAQGIIGGFAVGIAQGIALGIAGGIALGIAQGIAQGTAQGIALGIAQGIAGGIAVLRCCYHPLHLFFVWPRVRGGWYPHHPVAWDDLCSVPFPGLDRLLAAYHDANPVGCRIELARLILEYPSQRHAALKATAILSACDAAAVGDLTRLSSIVMALPEGERGFLKQTPRVREMVDEIAAAQSRLDQSTRPFLRGPYAESVRDKVAIFRAQVVGFEEPLATEFLKAADAWLVIAEKQLQEVREALNREPTPQVFRAGDPVDRDSEAFVPRLPVVESMEKQIMRAKDCPGIVLYGRRRMGKSTILRNLTGFLPTEASACVVSMQNPAFFTSSRHFIESLANLFRETLPKIAVDADPVDLPGLFRALSDYDARLELEGRRIIVGIDEYENIDRKIGEGAFGEDLLATIRESIQTHRQLIWIFAGSHEITELTNAPWTSYLVSTRTLEIGCFTPAETRQLLTNPLARSDLWPRGWERPGFAPEFWGEGGIDRIHRDAGGWPHLVQLIASVTVDLVNDEGVDHVTDELHRRANEEAVVQGQNVLYELMRGESRLSGEWEYLYGFRRNETQPEPNDPDVARSLRRRLLIEEQGGEWRLRVPLMREWLIARG